MPLVLIRRPKSANAAKAIVKQEVRAALNTLADNVIDELQEDVSDWVQQPDFSSKITLGKVWRFVIKYDGRTTAGKHYKFVDEGTAERGGKGPPYPIVAKNAPVLAFYVPSYPKTLPNTGFGGRPLIHQVPEGDVEQDLVLAKKVMHPGITPRRFTESMRDKLRSPGPKNFKNTVDAAIKRGIRKLGS